MSKLAPTCCYLHTLDHGILLTDSFCAFADDCLLAWRKSIPSPDEWGHGPIALDGFLRIRIPQDPNATSRIV